jgi:hypothetical protein
MVANMAKTAERFISPPEPIIAGRWRIFRFTRSDTEALVRMGIVPEDASTELLHGMLLHTDRAKLGEDPLSVGEDHTLCVEALSDLRTKINNSDRHFRSQQPLICSDIHEPQPDFMVLRGALKSYTQKPTAGDALCVGIVQYVIVNLRNRSAEVYTHPDPAAGTYPPPQIIADGTLSLRIADAQMFSLPLNDLLP